MANASLSKHISRRPHPAIAGAAFICLLSLLIYLFGQVPVVPYILKHNDLPRVKWGGGFRLMSGGFFEAMGMPAMIAGIVLSGLITIGQTVAGVWLWQSRRLGAWLSLATEPLFLIVGLGGFMMPYVPLLAIIRTGLILSAWNKFERD
jgi:hypothetical protein